MMMMMILEESLQMKRSWHPDGRHFDIEVTLAELGRVTAQTGDLEMALQYLEESLRIERFLCGDDNHPGIATLLQEIAQVTAQMSDHPNE